MKHLDLFSGIGGFALAASWVWGDEHEIVSFVEIDKFCQKVLNKHWPLVPIIEDIRDVTYERILAYAEHSRHNITENRIKTKQDSNESQNGIFKRDGGNERTTSPTIDLLTGGFPCQPFSCAGKRRGSKDDRALWPEMLRVIQEVRPAWIIGENVAGIINMELDTVLSDLESAAYEVQSFFIPACGVDAPHRRDRVWIVAHSNGKRQQEQRVCVSTRNEKESDETSRGSQDVADPGSKRTFRQPQKKKIGLYV